MVGLKEVSGRKLVKMLLQCPYAIVLHNIGNNLAAALRRQAIDSFMRSEYLSLDS